jgi:tRNA threonylcarbamoyladenosine biosynthesis protein TsaB
VVRWRPLRIQEIFAVPGVCELSLARQGVRLFRPWAEYIIGYRLVKLVQKARESRESVATVRLIKHEAKLAESIILAIDTSAKATSMAIARGPKVLRSSIEPADEKRSDTLWTGVQSLLAELGLTIVDVDVFSVCVGPGGFTGLRVGVAAVKGFAAATNKPIIGVTSLEAAAFAAKPAASVCAMLNAYKGEVYSQLFSFEGEAVPVPRNDPMVSTLEMALERVAGENELVFVGDGAETGAEVIRSAAGSRGEAKWTTHRSDHGLAEDVARLSFLKSARGGLETVEGLKACYVRPSEAEIKLSLGLLGSKIKRVMNRE